MTGLDFMGRHLQGKRILEHRGTEVKESIVDAIDKKTSADENGVRDQPNQEPDMKKTMISIRRTAPKKRVQGVE
jgi:hypothetical protein